MNTTRLVLAIMMTAITFGVATAFFARRLPASGRTALWLLCVPVVSIIIFPFDMPLSLNRVIAGVAFFASWPFCLAYSIHARRRSPQRHAALAGLAGSIFLSPAYLVMMPQVVRYAFREFTGTGLAY
jgi:hypothetical protein